MKKNLYKFTAVFVAIFISGCAIKELDYEVVENFSDENISVDREWYKNYNQKILNEYADLALRQSSDLRTAMLNIDAAYANAGLSRSDLIPTLSAGHDMSRSRKIDRGDEFRSGFSTSVGVSYELDLFGKFRSSMQARKWDIEASFFDLESVKLSLVNSVVSEYFYMLYLNDAIKFTRENLEIYQNQKEIISAKYSLGRSGLIELRQIEQSYISLENRLNSLNKELENVKKLLRDLLGSELEFSRNLPSILSVKPQGVSLEVPFSALSNRPDLRANISRINSAFYDHKRAKLNFYPSISLGANLSSKGNFDESFEMSDLSGLISIKLPFLDYSRLKSRLKISEIEFNKAVVQYEKSLNLATNEVRNLYKIYEIESKNLENLKANYQKTSEIAELYRIKYESGSAELKSYLEAKNLANSAMIDMLNGHYNLLNSEISVYKAMAGKFIKQGV